MISVVPKNPPFLLFPSPTTVGLFFPFLPLSVFGNLYNRHLDQTLFNQHQTPSALLDMALV